VSPPPAEAVLPATPQTLLSEQASLIMESDEEVNSIMSGSEDGFGEDMDSSVDFDAGESMASHLQAAVPLELTDYRVG